MKFLVQTTVHSDLIDNDKALEYYESRFGDLENVLFNFYLDIDEDDIVLLMTTDEQDNSVELNLDEQEIIEIYNSNFDNGFKNTPPPAKVMTLEDFIPHWEALQERKAYYNTIESVEKVPFPTEEPNKHKLDNNFNVCVGHKHRL